MVTLEGVANTALTIGIMLISVIGAVGITVGIMYMIRYMMRYSQFKCVIWERDGFGQLKQTFDKGGIFVDSKTKNKRLFLKNSKVGLNPDNIPYIQSSRSKTIYLMKTGLKNFHFIRLNIKEPALNVTVGEEDVNWGINAYERQKKMFSQSLLLQLMPFIALGFVSIIILIIFIYFFREFGTLAQTANALQKAAEAIAQANSGTVVLPS